ncbi:hypothetical protein DXG01_015917 [Tephrocybe rancida]|nr:hypothetical protein DXG01_015917 [Tephrocybe rancida]
MTSTASKPRINLKLSARPADTDSNPQSASPEPSTRRRTAKHRILSDDDNELDGQNQEQLDNLSSPVGTSTFRGRSHTHTVEGNSDSEAEHASPEPEQSPLSQPSSSRPKRPKGKKSTDGPHSKRKRIEQDTISDEEYHVAPASEDDEHLILHTKRQSKPTAKAKANKGKGKSFSVGARDERRPGRPQPNATETKASLPTGTKRPRATSKATSKAEDDPVDIVGDVDVRPNTRSPSPPPKEPAPPPPKRRKYPTINKNKGATASEPASKAGHAAGLKSATPQLSDLPKPTLVGSRVPPTMVGSSDFDLRDANVYKDLFLKPGGNAGLALQKKNEERQKEINKMRDEARAKRMSEMATSFDLQTQFEKIKRFEETLGRSCLYPNFLASKWRDVWENERRKVAMESEQGRLQGGSWGESGQKEEGEVRGHSAR